MRACQVTGFGPPSAMRIAEVDDFAPGPGVHDFEELPSALNISRCPRLAHR